MNARYIEEYIAEDLSEKGYDTPTFYLPRPGWSVRVGRR